MKNNETGIVDDVSEFDQVIDDIKLANGDAILKFREIPCLDLGQFDGHYLGKFNVVYKMIVKPW